MTLNSAFWGARQLVLTSGATSNRTFNGSPDDGTRGLSLTAGLFNNSNSGVTHTFNVRIGIDASNVTLRTATLGATTVFNREIFGNNNTITFDGAGTTTVAAVISGTGNVTKSGSGTLTVNTSPSYSGSTTISAGILALASNLTSSAITANGGTLSITENVTVGTVTINSGATLNVASGKILTVNGTLTINSGASVSDAVLARIVLASSGSIVTHDPGSIGFPSTSQQITGDAGWRTLSVPVNNVAISQITGTGELKIQGFGDGFDKNFYTNWNGSA